MRQLLLKCTRMSQKPKLLKERSRSSSPWFKKRKELVFRVEQVRAAINRGQSKSSIDALVGKAMEAFVDLPSFSNEKWLKCDGLETPILLGNLWSIACSMHEDFADDLQKNAEAALERTKARTRSGAGKRGSAQVRQQGSTCNTEKVSNNGAGNSQGDWTDKDTKWISHFNVTNIQRTSKCYSDCFGMKVLRECQQNGKDHMFLGFEKDKTTLHLMYKDGTRELQIGQGFGHVTLTNDDVRKVAKTIESSTFCTLLNKPCRVEGCSTVIAFASDPNEIMFEIIQSSSKFEAICHLVLYAYDIDRSTRFYEKGLGMRILKTKNENMYKMVWLSFGDEDRATVLEFRSSIDGNHCDMGDVYYQMVIETVNVQESYEILKKVSEEEGAKILEEPTADRKVCSFLDPDGWRVVLIEHTDPDKVRHIL